MKNYAAIAVLVCLALVALAAVPGHAQMLFKGNVPFDFRVNREVLPAGEFGISLIGWSSQALVLFSGVRGVEIMMPMTTESRRGLNRTKLIFHRYGSEYFLAEMWTSVEGFTRTFPVHPRERQLIAKTGLTPEIAVVYPMPSFAAGK